MLTPFIPTSRGTLTEGKLYIVILSVVVYLYAYWKTYSTDHIFSLQKYRTLPVLTNLQHHNSNL